MGDVALYLGIIALAVSSVGYLVAGAGSKYTGALARRAYTVYAALVSAASLVLLAALLRGDFRYSYVYAHVCDELPLIYRISAFWAGQQGSVLFWLLAAALLGLLWRRQAGNLAMGVYAALQLVLLVMLLGASPFELLATVPDHGMSLNPLLQNPWMAIHPPLIFVGYAAWAIPCAAVVALALGEPAAWDRVRPWALAAWATLGTGIFLGAYWAYGVLGWGYWSWDPVENASLVPWLTGGALVHCLARGRGRSLAATLAPLTLALVFTATLITRSGILADFSVHSFSETGSGSLLAAVILVLCALAAWIAQTRRRAVAEEIGQMLRYPCLATAGGMVVLALVILVGTMFPAISGVAGRPVSLDGRFFSLVTGVAAALGLALLAWTGDRGRLGLICSATGGALFVMTAAGGWALPAFALPLAAAAGFAAGSSLYRLIRTKGRRPGAALSHLGLALLVLGIAVSSLAQQRTMLELEAAGRPAQAFGHSLALTRIDEQGTERYLERTLLLSLAPLDRDGSAVAARARTITPSMRVQPPFGQMGRPYIRAGWWADLFVAPVQLDPGTSQQVLTLRRGVAAATHGVQLLLREFAFRQSGEDGSATFAVIAVIEVTSGGATVVAEPHVLVSDTAMQTFPVQVEGIDADVVIAIEEIRADEASVVISLHGEAFACCAPAARAVVEVRSNPLVSLIWLGGTLAILATSAAATYRRQAGA